MSEFGKERLRSIAGFIAGLLTLRVFISYGMIRESGVAFESAFGGGASGVTGGIPELLWVVTSAYYVAGAFPVWIARLKNQGRFDSFEAWTASFQSASGIITVAFVAWHLICFVYAAGEVQEGGLVGWAAAYLQSSPLIPAVYAIGIIALAFHVANGGLRFAIGWGLATGEKAMGYATIVASVLFGWMALTGFETIAVFLRGA